MSANFIDSELSALKDAVAMALEYANSLGTSAAEVAISKQQGLSVSTRLKEVETVEFNKDGALGITLYRDGHKGSSSTSDLSPEAIRQAVKAADGIARYTSEDPASGLADSELMAKDFPDLDLYHPVTPAGRVGRVGHSRRSCSAGQRPEDQEFGWGQCQRPQQRQGLWQQPWFPAGLLQLALQPELCGDWCRRKRRYAARL